MWWSWPETISSSHRSWAGERRPWWYGNISAACARSPGSLLGSGNHDLDAPNETGEKIAKWLGGGQTEGVSSDGESFVIDYTLFTICPWWDGPITRAGIAAQLAEAARQPHKQWIWIHHAPPDKSPISWGGARYFGDTELAQWIGEYQPDIVFCGHVHQSPFVKDGSSKPASCSMVLVLAYPTII